ncbi:hypothetical protein A2926_02040 [Candidatus Giovannonibacteria bacterium RIFCSPLOWO2_01_FULL_44_40]|uniref:Uncharacterized protein n=1 Tax=Candidatus Giovannonibacteria bacterium RIFCSPHIGHO2_01_FULL_45_23 TaxID=1798325 RepID=A0A1F5VFG0_9BACT|nr:MAG: hypothetical protein A2834_02260 [Candidatus Giovannonibacteria bacterium RIFCSPHIGHO2_01_FULL_45_23]OGF75039.1 MAG: hypothetical protein A3C77_02565 [Candidatus Giovannonibacteria bacterium RIFCSPHIGHO2_02_FULL_45_13]OGF80349.1 MAG: hypothetical protein A2926_02040 [Candidatus Giovannonibacteria bacterium RIFCSPLOWO2_01_FULL_44_40]
MRKPRHFYGKRYKSGDSLADWIFRRFIEAANFKVKQIVLKRRLKSDEGELLEGQWDPNIGVLELNPARSGHKKQYDILQSFIHELCHILLNTVHEKVLCSKVEVLEKILWEKFTPQQKRALRSFIPKDEGN